MNGPELRRASRALVLDPTGALLLMQFRLPWRGPIWVTPGGGLEAGETTRTALVRELREETGLAVEDPGPEIWRREHEFRWKERRIRQHETYFWIRAERFEPTAHALEQGDEADLFLGYRWWPVAELPDHSSDFVPRPLGRLVRALLRDGPPREPVWIPA